MGRIILRDWMCHGALDVETRGPVTFIVGANGSGKTAIRDACEFAYLGTGKLRGIDTKKDLGQLAIRDGADACTVEVEAGTVAVRRTMRRDGSQKLWRAERDEATGAWSPFAPHPLSSVSAIGGLAEDVVRAMLEPTGFLALPPQRRRELLIASTTDGESGEDVIADALREACGHPSNVASAEVNACARIAAASGFRAAEQHAVEMRREAKRSLAAIIVPQLVDAECDGVMLAANTLAQHEAALRAVEEQLKDAMVHEGVDRELLDRDLSGARQQVAELTAELDALGDVGEATDDAHRDAVAKLGAAEAALRSADAKLVALRDRAVALEAALVKLREPFVKPKKCPALPEFSCPVTDEQFAPLVKATRKSEQARLEEEFGAVTRDVEAATFARASAQDAFVTARNATDEIQAARKAEKAKLEQRSRVAKALEVQRAEVTRCEEKLAAVDARRASGAERSDQLRARVERGRRIVEAKRSYDQNVAERALAEQHTVIARQRVERWDQLAKALAPDGIEGQLGGGARDRFLGYLAEAEVLCGTAILDEGYGLSFRGKHPVQLSTSQRLAAGIAIQHALCRSVAFPMLICDAVDLFDPSQRANFLDFARSVSDSYPGGVVGLATSGRVSGPSPAGVAIVRLGELASR